MKSIPKSILVAAIVFLLTACYSFKIQSNKEAGYDKFLGKTAIIVATGNVKLNVTWENEEKQKSGTVNVMKSKEVPLAEYLAVNIETQFGKLGIDCKAFHVNDLELNPNKMEADIKAFAPEHVLTFGLKEGTVNHGNILVSGFFDALLYDASLDRNVWRAKFEMQNYTDAQFRSIGVDTGAIDRLIMEIIKKMKDDSLIIEIPDKSV